MQRQYQQMMRQPKFYELVVLVKFPDLLAQSPTLRSCLHLRLRYCFSEIAFFCFFRQSTSTPKRRQPLGRWSVCQILG